MEKKLHYLLYRAFQYNNRRIVRQTEKMGLMPGQPKILEYLLEHEGALSKEIGLGCTLDKSTVAGLLPRLEQQGMICRKEHETDRRAARIFLTPAGRKAAERVKKICEEADRIAFHNFSEEEENCFTDALRKIIENISLMPGNEREEEK